MQKQLRAVIATSAIAVLVIAAFTYSIISGQLRSTPPTRRAPSVASDKSAPATTTVGRTGNSKNSANYTAFLEMVSPDVAASTLRFLGIGEAEKSGRDLSQRSELRALLETAPRTVLVGSTVAQINAALDLCRKYSDDVSARIMRTRRYAKLSCSHICWTERRLLSVISGSLLIEPIIRPLRKFTVRRLRSSVGASGRSQGQLAQCGHGWFCSGCR